MFGFTPTIMGKGIGFDPSTPLGTFTDGGYYLGQIVDGGIAYALIVAPVASGLNTSVQWKNSNSATAGTQSDTNGPQNTDNMSPLGDHPVANWVKGLSIGGYADWYIPAISELEEIYTNRTYLPTGEEYTSNPYWSSTENSSNTGQARRKRFDTGTTDANGKVSASYARAVRRLPMAT